MRKKISYKIVDQYIGSTISFYDARLIGLNQVYLDYDLSRATLKRLHDIGHPAVEKIEKIEKPDDEANSGS